jgi:HD-GYP domain-containing protein (c-di-GMP phosphodiesterase class II)
MVFPSVHTTLAARRAGDDPIPPGMVAFARELGLNAQTLGHLDRTQRIGMALTERVDPALAARPEVRWGFYLHDVGKAGIPDEVLLKPGPLSDDEWVVMRAHPEIGARLLAPIPEFQGAIKIVRSHHERWDGTGYPSGTAGRKIPLAARIFAVADSFDAMTTDRPYRRALPLDFALDEIREGAGTQFDPTVVAAFMTMVTEGDLPEPRRLVSARIV